MPIGNRRLPLVLPRYSLTGDLLSFRRCPLQYRYLNGSKLPPSRPVQLWFGEFIHGVLEMSYRIWRDTTPRLSFPWPEHRADWRAEPDPTWATHDIGRIGYSVEQALRAQGKSSRDRDAREAAYRRAFRAVNDIGPHLFPLVVAAEEKIIGTRLVGGGPTQGRTDRYELHGIVDVLTSLTLGMVDRSNLIRTAIQDVTSGLNGNYEVIVDYKGARRPDLADPDRPYWQQGEWQVLTYAWLRGRQPGAIPVAAGVLLYINELSPGQDDIAAMKRALSSNNSDVLPAQGTADWYALTNWRPGLQIPALTDEF
ncbi:MAG: PD-(D/E)XK nuclease family protein [Phycisphaerales bacterium]